VIDELHPWVEKFLSTHADCLPRPHVCAAVGACVVAAFFPFSMAVSGGHEVYLAAIVAGHILFDDFEGHGTVLFLIARWYEVDVGISLHSSFVLVMYMTMKCRRDDQKEFELDLASHC
jgi:hypothetical protein